MSEGLAILHFLFGACFALALLYIVQPSNVRPDLRRGRQHWRSSQKQTNASKTIFDDFWNRPQSQAHSTRWYNKPISSVHDQAKGLVDEDFGSKGWGSKHEAASRLRSLYCLRRPSLRGGGGSHEDGKDCEGDNSEAKSDDVEERSQDSESDYDEEELQAVMYDPRPRQYYGVKDRIGVAQQSNGSRKRGKGKKKGAKKHRRSQ